MINFPSNLTAYTSKTCVDWNNLCPKFEPRTFCWQSQLVIEHDSRSEVMSVTAPRHDAWFVSFHFAVHDCPAAMSTLRVLTEDIGFYTSPIPAYITMPLLRQTLSESNCHLRLVFQTFAAVWNIRTFNLTSVYVIKTHNKPNLRALLEQIMLQILCTDDFGYYKHSINCEVLSLCHAPYCLATFSSFNLTVGWDYVSPCPFVRSPDDDTTEYGQRQRNDTDRGKSKDSERILCVPGSLCPP